MSLGFIGGFVGGLASDMFGGLFGNSDGQTVTDITTLVTKAISISFMNTQTNCVSYTDVDQTARQVSIGDNCTNISIINSDIKNVQYKQCDTSAITDQEISSNIAAQIVNDITNSCSGGCSNAGTDLETDIQNILINTNISKTLTNVYSEYYETLGSKQWCLGDGGKNIYKITTDEMITDFQNALTTNSSMLQTIADISALVDNTVKQETSSIFAVLAEAVVAIVVIVIIIIVIIGIVLLVVFLGPELLPLLAINGS